MRLPSWLPARSWRRYRRRRLYPRAAFEELLEPLKQIRAPPCPGKEAFVCDRALYGFEVVLGSTSFSYQWHTIPPKGWEPLAEWLYGAVCQLRSLTNVPTS